MAEEPPLGGTTEEWHTGSHFGPYLLKRLLGRGAFGEVYEALDTRKSRSIALKLLPPSYSADPSFRRRLFREASTAGRLNEPHVVPIHDFGEIEGKLFIDMRLIPGTDLRTVLDESGPLDPVRAVSIVAQIASALDAAHAEQIVHRDVKPANILLAPEDFACLVDFGLASAATDVKLTSTGTTVGTFAYMAPERFTDAEVDHRSDIYALTCVLYECLTGATPYSISDRTALIAAHLASPIPRPSRYPGVPAGFDDVIAQGMAKEGEDRYPKAADLASAAHRALSSAPPQDKTTVATMAPVADATTDATAGTGKRRRRIPSRAALVAIGVVVALVAAAAAIGWFSSRHHRPSAAAPKPAMASIARIAATIGVGKRPEAVAIDAVNHVAYTANYQDDSVSMIDTVRRAVAATVPVGKGPVGIAVDPASHTACTANNRDDSVSVIDTVGGAVAATVRVGTNPWGVSIDPSTRAAYVANMWDYTVSVINLDSRTVTATIPVGKNPYGVAIDPTAHTAYVANSSDGTLSAIDTHSLAVVATIPVGNDPRGVAVDPLTHTAYVTNEAEGATSVVNLENRRVIATIHIGNSPYGVTVDPANQIVYTANHDSAVSVIDAKSFTIVGAIRIGKDTFAVDVDPINHIVYTANQDNTVSVIEPAGS
ncbi:serine/threonine-protein kinase [Mycobacterium vicinigordonae]|uniref:non-specific serine/threonine protein kinase n=1 Tax=Mycobacterium vicinigordonae TaxID=1719132 RepID=A0A7D6IK05_9MYCO|nr:serine/threonine-protein kinase [Mycobacterium vicinigordonae]QLL05860.1 protein kinase [Mycobacterium vicinigordonae]